MKIRKVAIALTVLFSTTLAFGGLVQGVNVEVGLNPDGSGGASGDMVSARFSENLTEYIGCGVRINSDPTFGFVLEFAFCQAVSADGTAAFCSTEDPILVDAVRSISDFSFLTFGFDENGTCRRIGNSTQSFYIPDFAKKAK